MSRFHIELYGIPKPNEGGGPLHQGFNIEYDLTESNRQEFLINSIADTERMNPKFTNIRVIYVKEKVDNIEEYESPEELDENGFKLVYTNEKWLK